MHIFEKNDICIYRTEGRLKHGEWYPAEKMLVKVVNPTWQFILVQEVGGNEQRFAANKNELTPADPTDIIKMRGKK